MKIKESIQVLIVIVILNLFMYVIIQHFSTTNCAEITSISMQNGVGCEDDCDTDFYNCLMGCDENQKHCRSICELAYDECLESCCDGQKIPVEEELSWKLL